MYMLGTIGPFNEPDSYAGMRVVLGGASDETKPTDVLAGSFWLEDDTGKWKVFDGTTNWSEIE